MILPLHPEMVQGEMMPVPEVVKNRHVYAWYIMVILLLGVAVTEIVGGDVMAAVFFVFLASIVVHMVLDSCKNMSMHCLLLFGTMVGFQAFFEFMALLAVINGRSTETTTIKGGQMDETGSEITEVTYITKIITRPLFDKKLGERYNVQSAAMVASPVVLVLCCLLCYISYNAYTSSLFEEDVESGPIHEGFAGRSYGAPGRQTGHHAAPQSGSTAARIFEGRGQRLGS
eukprot:TRINITY_DN59771_c0_g1_i1.p1 TRINITY_DN59771_c0_g1~~TRINITY_DN59771_c0_g1_i1.p1  ORF type:complete len:229 (+),score=31.92 TRINITY_DN59771_c0_g1_i1:147-833(+)